MPKGSFYDAVVVGSSFGAHHGSVFSRGVAPFPVSMVSMISCQTRLFSSSASSILGGIFGWRVSDVIEVIGWSNFLTGNWDMEWIDCVMRHSWFFAHISCACLLHC